jgi:hypothetical protein
VPPIFVDVGRISMIRDPDEIVMLGLSRVRGKWVGETASPTVLVTGPGVFVLHGTGPMMAPFEMIEGVAAAAPIFPGGLHDAAVGNCPNAAPFATENPWPSSAPDVRTVPQVDVEFPPVLVFNDPMNSSPTKSKARTEPVPNGPTTISQGEKRVVSSDGLKEAARLFRSHLNALNAFGFNEVRVRVSLAPGEPGRKALEAIKLLECADRDSVQVRCERFKNDTDPTQRRLIEAIRYARSSRVKISALLKGQDKTRNRLVRLVRDLRREAANLPTNFRKVYQLVQRLEQLEMSWLENLRRLEHLPLSNAKAARAMPDVYISILTGLIYKHKSDAAAMNLPSVRTHSFFCRVLAEWASNFAQIVKPITELNIEPVTLELADVWLKGIKHGNGLADFQLDDDDEQLNTHLHQAYASFGKVLELLIAAKNQSAGEASPNRVEQPRSPDRQQVQSAVRQPSERDENPPQHSTSDKSHVIRVDGVHEVYVDDKPIEYFPTRKVVLCLAVICSEGETDFVMKKQEFLKLFGPNPSIKDQRGELFLVVQTPSGADRHY